MDAAYRVHSELGPGLLESAYERVFCYELKKRGLKIERQKIIPFEYDGRRFDEGFRLDVLVEGAVICELKASEKTHQIWKAQIMTYLKLMEKRLGFLINFNVPKIKKGIQRIII